MREFLLQCVRGIDIETKPHGTEIVVELKRIGNNINQIARRINEGRADIDSDCLTSIRTELQMIRTAWL